MKDLSQKALLVSLNIRQWSGRKFDAEVTQKTNSDYGAVPDAGRYSKRLMPQAEVKAIQKIANEARSYHYENTLPWTDEGWRILPVKNYMNYKNNLHRMKGAYSLVVGEFCSRYEELKLQAQRELNGLFKAEDYPENGRLAEKFSFGMDFVPVPEQGDFRVALNHEDLQALEESLKGKLERNYQEAVKDLWQRMRDAVSHIVERLSDKDNIFRDSMLKNLEELVNLLPALNIGDDPQIEAMRQEMKTTLCKYDPDTIRKNEMVRKIAHDDAEELLKKMDSYMIQ